MVDGIRGVHGQFAHVLAIAEFEPDPGFVDHHKIMDETALEITLSKTSAMWKDVQVSLSIYVFIGAFC